MALQVDVTAIGEKGGVLRVPSANGISPQHELGQHKPSVPNGAPPKRPAGAPKPALKGKQQPGKPSAKDGAREVHEKQLQREAVVSLTPAFCLSLRLGFGV